MVYNSYVSVDYINKFFVMKPSDFRIEMLKILLERKDVLYHDSMFL